MWCLYSETVFTNPGPSHKSTLKIRSCIFLKASFIFFPSFLSQVVLPILGYNIQYPKNKVGQWYHDIRSRDGLQTCRFKVPTLKLNVPGCYRQILKHPRNLSYQLMEDHDIDVKMKGSHIDETALSLLISFDLDASCYATVCLKEIMKHDVLNWYAWYNRMCVTLWRKGN